jgi:hypothetical protein
LRGESDWDFNLRRGPSGRHIFLSRALMLLSLPGILLLFLPLYPCSVDLAGFLLTSQGPTWGIIVSSVPYLQINPHIPMGQGIQHVETVPDVIRFEKTLK